VLASVEVEFAEVTEQLSATKATGFSLPPASQCISDVTD